MSPGSAEAALRAAGAAVAAVDAVVAGDGTQRLLRAAPARPSRRARARDGLLPVQQRRDRRARGARGARPRAGLDLRFRRPPRQRHPGASSTREPRVQYLSTHQWPLYPGTGARAETGVGNIVNRPLPAGTGSKEWRARGRGRHPAGDRRLRARADHDLGRLRRPSRRSAGDARAGRGRLRLGHARARWRSPTRHAGGRVVSVLEGGYDLAALASSCLAHLDALR